MYHIIKKHPSKELIETFKMQESSNETYANFKIDLNELSSEQRKQLITKYQLDQKVLTYKESLFLSFPLKV